MNDFVKGVTGFPGYFVTRDGRLYVEKHRSMHGRGGLWWMHIPGEKMKRGYVRVCLTKNKKGRKFLLHVLVAMAFLHKPSGATQVNHKDGNKQNNVVENLEWVTQKENMAHAWRIGLRKPKLGQQHPLSKLTDEQACQIKTELANPYRGICVELAKKYGVHRTTIGKIKSGANWRHA